ncbi:MAG: response regulator [Promethearchaeota archaeon]
MTEKKYLLLVEDSEDVIIILKKALKKDNIMNDLVVAWDGSEALEFLFGNGSCEGRDIAQLPEVILIDLNMPKINGLEVLKTIRSDLRTKLLPVVIVTASKEESDIIRGYELGVNRYITKPFDFNQYHMAIANWVCMVSFKSSSSEEVRFEW